MRKLTLILVIAFVLRLGWALLVPVDPVSDSAMYDSFAREIAAGHGYMFPGDSPTVYWPVGPAALYGFLYVIFGAHGWVVAAANIVMGVATVWLIGAWAERLFGERVGLLAALFVAIWPLWIQFTTILSSELPFILLLSAALFTYGSGRFSWPIRSMLSTVMLVGAAFMRPTAIPLIIALPLLQIFITRSLKRTAMELVLAVAVAGVLFAPWAMRNQSIFGSPVLVSANFGANLWMGNNPNSNGGYMPLPVDFENEVERDNFYKEKAVAFIKGNPLQYIVLCLKRIPLSFGRETIGVAWNKLDFPPAIIAMIKIVSSGYWLLLLVVAAIGVGRFIVDRPMRIFDPIIVFPAMFTAVAIMVVGQDRYHMSLMPFIAIFAAFAIDRLGNWYASRRKNAGEPSIIAIAN